MEQHAEIHEEEIIPPNSCPEPPVITPTSETELSPVFPALPEKYLKNLGIKREKMKNELVQLFDEKEIYTNGNLTITDVAALLGTNRTYVSNVINNEFGFSFYQFVNKYRIQKATILFIQHPDMQIQEVASLSGLILFPRSSLPSNSTRVSPQNNGNNVTWTLFNNFEYVKTLEFVQVTTEKVKL